MNHKDDIMVTVKSRDGILLRVPIEYAQKAINSGLEDNIEIESGTGLKFMEEYAEHLRKRRQDT